MSNINLRQTVQKNESVKKTGGFSGGIIIPILIIVLSLGAWGGLEFYKRSITDQISAVDAEITAASAEVSVKDLERVVAFQERTERIDKKLKIKNTPDTLFGALQQAVVPGASIVSFDLAEKNVKLTMSVDKYQTVAKQVLSLKKSTVFNDVTVTGATKNDKGEITVALKMAVDLM